MFSSMTRIPFTRLQGNVLSFWTIIYGSVNYSYSTCFMNSKSHSKLSALDNISRSHNFVSMEKVNASSYNHSRPTSLRLSDYDCIGFDLDNTLCEYNVSSLVQMEFNVLANFLVKQKGYDPSLLKTLDNHSINFLQKGLILDFTRGNVLKIGQNGIISKASHGTKFMNEKEIKDIYGSEKRWEVTDEFCDNMLVAWNGPLSEKMRTLLDYFDMPASLAFARIVDSLDNKLGRPADIYNIWPDVRDGLTYMYKREHFIEMKNGGFFNELKNNPERFIKPCDPVVINWLKQLKESKKMFLITGSNCDFASFTAEKCLGKNWRNLFDIVIFYAKKPGFFTGCRPFIELENCIETNPIDGSKLELGRMYSQGNWQELQQLFSRTLKVKEPKFLYFGDNLIQDVYTPSEFTKCDTIGVVEELGSESLAKDLDSHLNSDTILLSQSWGSYFYDEKEQTRTIWGSIVNKYSKMCIPNLSAMAQYSIDKEYKTFSNSSKDGYFPVDPPFSIQDQNALRVV